MLTLLAYSHRLDLLLPSLPRGSLSPSLPVTLIRFPRGDEDLYVHRQTDGGHAVTSGHVCVTSYGYIIPRLRIIL